MGKEKLLTSKSFQFHPDYFRLDNDGNGDTQEIVVQMLEETVFGQREACEDIARAMVRNMAGFRNPQRPEYVGMFLGQPGVGKTEMGKAIAKVYEPQNYESCLKVIDCSIFQASHDVSRITGAAPGYVGYDDDPMITSDFLLKQNVIVFDEIEKANSSLHRLLLRIMDKGRLDTNRVMNANDENGLDTGLDFSRSTIIFTSNIGSEEITEVKKGKRSIGFGTKSNFSNDREIKEIGKNAAIEYWRGMPEFINRLDSIVVFNSMTKEVQYQLLEKFLNDYKDFQYDDEGSLLLTQDLKDWLIEGSDLSLAGREVRRNLEKHVISKAAEVRMNIPGRVPLVADISREDKNKVVFWVNKTMLANEINAYR